MSRPTMIVPDRDRRVDTGYLVSSASTSAIGRLRSIFTTSPSPCLRYSSGMSSPGLASSFSIQRPLRSILAFTLRSAEQLTPIPMGHDAPWRGRRITRMSWAKYLPPNCAPRPSSSAAFLRVASSSMSRNAWPYSLPWVGRLSRYFTDAFFTTSRFFSADVPPITNAMW